MTKFIGIVCGLKAEAESVRASLKSAGVATDKFRIGVSGANAGQAQVIASDFCRDGAAAIVSAGLSGGLDPALKTGELIVGDRVLTAADEILFADRRLVAALSDAGALTAAVFGADEIIASAADKKALFNRYQAGAVDMESHGAARAAVRVEAPFIAVRVITDDASRALPKAALHAVAPDGNVRALTVFAACLKEPQQFEQIVALGRDSAAAQKTLRRDFGRLFHVLLVALEL